MFNLTDFCGVLTKMVPFKLLFIHNDLRHILLETDMEEACGIIPLYLAMINQWKTSVNISAVLNETRNDLSVL